MRRWDTGHTLVISLTSGAEPYQIAPDCTAEFICQKSDGSLLKNSCQIADHQIFYRLTLRTTSLSGVQECEIRLLDGSGSCITSPRFSLAVYATIYDYGDAVESEIVNANTVKSANPGYAEVFMWSDGNPDGADRAGRFVAPDESRSPAMVRLCGPGEPVRGVSMAAPGFASNAPGERFDENSVLLSQYAYVGLLGLAPVLDGGDCVPGGRCLPGEGGIAAPDGTGTGFLVVERLGENRILVLLEPGAPLLQSFSQLMEQRLGQVRTLMDAAVGTLWTGEAPPYTQTVALPGILESDTPHITPVYSEALETALTQKEGWSMISAARSGENQLTFTCLEEKPAVEIPIQVEVIR